MTDLKEIDIYNDEELPQPEQQSLLRSGGSRSLDEQVVYNSVGSLSSAISGTDDDDNDTDLEGNDNDNDLGLELLKQHQPLTIWEIICILSTAFSYGCILTTLFLITLPVECERIEQEHPEFAKSVALGNFVAIAGVTQLISPFVGRLSDTFQPPPPQDIGQRLPFLILGSVLTVVGLLGEMFASYKSFWLRYSFAFFAHMIGLNVMYAMMLAMIPDQVPHAQTGIANGILAGHLVTGSLFGFGLFHGFLRSNIQSMYGLYTCIVIFSSILTGLYGHDRDVDMALYRMNQRRRSKRKKTRRCTAATSTGNGTALNGFGSPTASVDNKKKRPTRKQRVMRKLRKLKRVSQHVARTVVVTPTIILRSMLVDTIQAMDWRTFCQSYTIDIDKHSDFFWVTVSRLFYYCGMSVQTFFMYFLHDIIKLKDDPEGAVATLSIIGQLAGAITCVPVGIASDRYLSGKRKPFVYLACYMLAVATFGTIFARTMHHMVIVMIILGGANGIYLTMDTSLAVDTLPKDFDDENGSAQLLGIWGVAAFLGSALGPMIGGPVLYYVGSQVDNSTDVLILVDDDEHTTSIQATQEYSIKGYTILLSLSSVSFTGSPVFAWFRSALSHNVVSTFVTVLLSDEQYIS